MASEAERIGLFQAIGAYMDARRRRKAWALVSRGIALHPPIAQDIVKMVTRAATMGGSDER